MAVAELLPVGAETLMALRGHPVITGAVMSSPGLGPYRRKRHTTI